MSDYLHTIRDSDAIHAITCHALATTKDEQAAFKEAVVAEKYLRDRFHMAEDVFDRHARRTYCKIDGREDVPVSGEDKTQLMIVSTVLRETNYALYQALADAINSQGLISTNVLKENDRTDVPLGYVTGYTLIANMMDGMKNRALQFASVQDTRNRGI